MKEPTYERKGQLLKELATGAVRNCQSINSAKATSRELQKQGHVVRVVPHTSPKPRVFASRGEQRRVTQQRSIRPKSQADLAKIADAMLIKAEKDD